MSVFLYIIGMLAPIIVVTQHPTSHELKPWAKVGIIVLWPLAFTICGFLMTYYLWQEARKDG